MWRDEKHYKKALIGYKHVWKEFVKPIEGRLPDKGKKAVVQL